MLDRAQAKPVFMASAAGGMEIEEVAAKTPEAILKESIEPGFGLPPYQARKLAFGIGIPAASVNARRGRHDGARQAPTSPWTPRWPKSIPSS